MRQQAYRAALCVGFVLLGCESPTELAPDQEILFQVGYENYAWGYQRSGWYVDREGDVWTLDPAPMWRDEVDALRQGRVPAASYPAAEMEDGYGAARDSLVFSLPAVEVMEMSRLIRGAARGTYSQPEGTASDAGLHLVGALLYSSSDDSYRRIVVSIRGDWTVLNRSREARQLEEWIRQVSLRVLVARFPPP